MPESSSLLITLPLAAIKSLAKDNQVVRFAQVKPPSPSPSLPHTHLNYHHPTTTSTIPTPQGLEPVLLEKFSYTHVKFPPLPSLRITENTKRRRLSPHFFIHSFILHSFIHSFNHSFIHPGQQLTSVQVDGRLCGTDTRSFHAVPERCAVYTQLGLPTSGHGTFTTSLYSMQYSHEPRLSSLLLSFVLTGVCRTDW